MKVPVNFDAERYKSKPKRYYGKLQNRMTEPKMMEISVLANELVHGANMRICACSGGSGDINFKSGQLIGIDTDNKARIDDVWYIAPVIYNPEDVRRVLERAGIRVSFQYHTWSSTKEHPRFRTIITLDRALDDYGQYRAIMLYVNGLFDVYYADRDATTVSRMFCGSGCGETCYSIFSAINRVDDLLAHCSQEEIDQYNRQHEEEKKANREEATKNRQKKGRSKTYGGAGQTVDPVVIDCIRNHDPMKLREHLGITEKTTFDSRKQMFDFLYQDFGLDRFLGVTAGKTFPCVFSDRHQNGDKNESASVKQMPTHNNWLYTCFAEELKLNIRTLTKELGRFADANEALNFLQTALWLEVKQVDKMNEWATPSKTLRPRDESDLGQAQIFVREYADKIRYSKQTGFLFYDGKVWLENDLKVQALSQKLTDRQMREAKEQLAKATQHLDRAIESGDKNEESLAKGEVAQAIAYQKYVVSRRASNKIRATMTEVAPQTEVDVKALDADGYLLNTPAGTVDLRTGEMREHQARDYCTKMTAVSPSKEGTELFDRFLNQITCGDTALASYLQETAGLCAIGVVKREELVIATGTGGNGKSTYYNLLHRVLGDYSGGLSSEMLTAQCRKNKSPEMAELRGKRMIISAELDEGARLDAGMVKKLCSTDPVMAERKYRDPFSFIPSHHLVLYTNYLPKVGSNDAGTWDRLVVVPFRARFRGSKGEVKDYASELFSKCGGAVLSWIIEGARAVIQKGFFIDRPLCVQRAIEEYRQNNDWLSEFIRSRCKVDDEKTSEGAQNLYSEYRHFCERTGEYIRSNAEFSQALEKAGYEGKRTKTGKRYLGIRVKTYDERKEDEITGNIEDFLKEQYA